MIDTGAEANICKYNCLPEDKKDTLKMEKVLNFYLLLFPYLIFLFGSHIIV